MKRPFGRRNRRGNHQQQGQNNKQAEGRAAVALPAA
jgi:hypothetical protein